GGHASELNQLEREFLDESQAASTREAARQQRANRRLRSLLALAAILLVAALVAGAIAFDARGAAKQQATEATAESLGVQALIEPTLDRSLLLAREGVNLDNSLATRSNLLAALLRSPAAVAVVRMNGKVLDEALSPD